MNTALYELRTTIYWNILRESVPGFIAALRENMDSHRVFNHRGMPGAFLSRSHRFEPMDAIYTTEDPRGDMSWGVITPDDEFINLIKVNGGITRDNACEFGSRAQRDQVLYASKCPNCIGHIFLINSPGGSAYSVDDYTEAIQAARAAGQPVIACIDGLCASAGYALACQCDAIFYTSPNNIVGCIGTMAIYMTQKDGDKHSISQEVYHEEYDPESYEKNIEMRQAADGDNSLILAQLKEHGRAFRELVKQCRPQVKDEQLHGLTFKASEVEGTLVDGQLSLQGCIDLLASKQFKPNQTTVPSASTEGNQTQATMITENLQTALIEAQSQLAEAQATLQQREQALQEAQAALDAAQSQPSEEVVALNKQVADLQAKVKQLEDQATVLNDSIVERDTTLAERDTSISDLQSQLAEAQNQATALSTTITERESTIAERDTQLAERDQTIADLQATLAQRDQTIQELSHQPSASATPSPATAGEGEGDEGKQTPMSACAAKPGMTIAEKREAYRQRMATLNAQTGH